VFYIKIETWERSGFTRSQPARLVIQAGFIVNALSDNYFKFRRVKKKSVINDTPVCQVRMQAISDTMGILSGKWKFHILGTLIEGNKLGFMDLLREIEGIGSKMLSKELQDLEMNHLISRTVMDTKPITVEYAITEYGATLSPLINELAKWGIGYRQSLHGSK
jgi:DNA-binding HxlR family transcriptional regulator